ncbi:hypothetical protein KAR48_10205 [bacterium]|nr:hypothetical protein [bacterium]
MKYQTVYFKKPGPQNTDETLEIVREWADMLSIKTIILPTTSGETAIKALDQLQFHNLIAVSHVQGFSNENENELLLENRKKIEARGCKILTAQHALGGVGRAVRNKLKTYQVDEIMAYTLRIMGQGIKVAVEIALMATDAGLVRTDEDAIVLGGSGKGIDTAVVIKPANAHRFFDLKIRGILCKPWEF